MEKSGIGMISVRYSARDFKRLNLSINSDPEKWDKAIEMFRDRFRERYFGPIGVLEHNCEEYGFAIMAINCLLIDTFYQFLHGHTKNDKNSQTYPEFLKSELPSIIKCDAMANIFYKSIRCGILHSAQTKDGCMLSTECEEAVEFFDNNRKIKVNVKLFSEKMEEYFLAYIDKLKNENNVELRQQFIKQMTKICI